MESKPKYIPGLILSADLAVVVICTDNIVCNQWNFCLSGIHASRGNS
jgi:hypothetical protein